MTVVRTYEAEDDDPLADPEAEEEDEVVEETVAPIAKSPV